MNAIELVHVTKTYKTDTVRNVVSDLTLTIKEGSVFGFLGPNGAGKTSTVKMLVDLSNPTDGEIKLLGKDKSDPSVKKDIGFMPEAPAFYRHLTGYEFLSFAASLFGIKKQDQKNLILELLKEVDLLDAKNRQVKQYSKGMKQRLGLAQALINDPKILFLDEPLDGLDPLGRAEVKKIILKLKEQGKTIFFNSHILSDVAEICDDVGIIDQGILIARGSPEELTKGYKDLEDSFVKRIEQNRKKAHLNTSNQ